MRSPIRTPRRSVHGGRRGRAGRRRYRVVRRRVPQTRVVRRGERESVLPKSRRRRRTRCGARTKAGGCQQVAKPWASLRVTSGRVSERRGLALGMGELLELVDVLNGVLVIRQNWEAVRDVLEPVLGDQV